MSDPISFNGIEKTRAITEQQREEFFLCSDEDQKILALKNVAQRIVPIYDSSLSYYQKLNYKAIEPTAGMSAKEYAQLYVIKNPVLFDIFGAFFPDLSRSVEEMLDLYVKDTADLALLEDQLTSLFKQLLGMKGLCEEKRFDLYIASIEKEFVFSDERKRIAYKALVKACDSLDILDGISGSRKILKKYFFKLEKPNEPLAIEIAKVLMTKSTIRFEMPIYRKHIKDEQFFIEVAKIEAAKGGMCLNIEDYGITDQDALFEIAKIAVSVSPWWISANIQDYGIRSEERRFEIAKIALAKQADVGIGEYKIQSPRYLLLLFLMVLENSPSNGLDYKGYFNFRDGKLDDLEQAFHLLNAYRIDFPLIWDYLDTFISAQGWESLRPVLKEQIEYIKNPRQKKAALCWIAHFLGRCYLESIPSTAIDFLIKHKWIQNSFSYRNLSTPYVFTNAMLTLGKDPMALNYYTSEAFRTFQKNNPKSRLKTVPPYAAMPLLVLSLLQAQGVSKEVCDAHFKQVCTSFKEGSATHSFKDGRYGRIYVNVLSHIAKTTELELEDKEYLLSKIFKEYVPCSASGNALNAILDDAELDLEERESLLQCFAMGFEEPRLIPLIPCLRTIQAISDLGKISNLKKSSLERAAFNDILLKSFQSVIPIKDIPNFAEQFHKHFGNARIPNYIIIYAAKLARLRGEDGKLVRAFLATCIDSLLDGTYLQKRYDLSSNPHLQTVFEGRDALFEEWKKGEKADLAQFLQKCDKEMQEVDFHQFLHNEIISDKHLDPDLLPHLRDLLKGTKTLSDARADVLKEEPCPLLEIQSKCIELVDPIQTISEKKILLKEIASLLLNVQGSGTFLHGITGLRNGLQKLTEFKETYDGYTIVDTDDFEDIALCGTEPDGSCQTIDGDPDNNKCLPGYIFDGKNRLIAIKDKEGKIVARRIFQNLLNDTQSPDLFLERCYPFVLDPKLSQALKLFAKYRAGKLGLKLFVEKSRGDMSPSHSLSSLGSPAPFEYVDALGGVGNATDGIYTITNACELID